MNENYRPRHSSRHSDTTRDQREEFDSSLPEQHQDAPGDTAYPESFHPEYSPEQRTSSDLGYDVDQTSPYGKPVIIDETAENADDTYPEQSSLDHGSSFNTERDSRYDSVYDSQPVYDPQHEVQRAQQGDFYDEQRDLDGLPGVPPRRALGHGESSGHYGEAQHSNAHNGAQYDAAQYGDSQYNEARNDSYGDSYNDADNYAHAESYSDTYGDAYNDAHRDERNGERNDDRATARDEDTDTHTAAPAEKRGSRSRRSRARAAVGATATAGAAATARPRATSSDEELFVHDKDPRDQDTRAFPLRGFVMIMIAVAVLLIGWGTYSLFMNKPDGQQEMSASGEQHKNMNAQGNNPAQPHNPGQPQVPGDAPAPGGQAPIPGAPNPPAPDAPGQPQNPNAPVAPLNPAQEYVAVLNNSRVQGLARDVATRMNNGEFKKTGIGNLPTGTFPESVVLYPGDNPAARQAAENLARSLRIKAQARTPETDRAIAGAQMFDAPAPAKIVVITTDHLPR